MGAVFNARGTCEYLFITKRKQVLGSEPPVHSENVNRHVFIPTALMFTFTTDAGFPIRVGCTVFHFKINVFSWEII